MDLWKLEGIEGGGDMAALLCAVGACDYVTSSSDDLREFCESKCLRHKAILEVNKLRQQLIQKNSEFFGINEEVDVKKPQALQSLRPPSAEQKDATRQIFLAAFGDHTAKMATDVTPEQARLGLVPYNCLAVDEPV